MNFPVFAQIRAERAAREMRGVVLPFQPRTVQQEVAAENTLAASWGELWLQLYDLWEDICMETLDIIQGKMTWDSMEIVEAEYNARLLREVFEH
jgi:hypothetical protein